MIDIVLKETPELTSLYEIIDIIYLLPDLKDKKVTAMLNNFRDHKEYLVAYNATRALGLPTGEVVEKFRNKNPGNKTTATESIHTKAEVKWWQKILGSGQNKG